MKSLFRCPGRNAIRSTGSSRGPLVVRANWGQPVEFAPCQVVSNEHVAGTAMSKIKVDVGKSAAALYERGGQYIQAKATSDGKAGFFAIASPPNTGNIVELLIKASPGTTSEAITLLPTGSTLLCSDPQGKGYPLERAEDADLVLLVCAGSGIAPIRAVIESGALKGKRVKLLYGSKAKEQTAYSELIQRWEAQGVAVTQVFSGETKAYVQNVVASELDRGSLLEGVQPSKIAALLCGHKDLCSSVTEKLIEKGVSKEAILLNF